MSQTNWTEENQVIKVMEAVEEMYAVAEKACKGTGVLPVQEQNTHKIYEFMGGIVPEKTIHLAIHHRIVFCADCDHVAGANPDECESCHDHQHGAPIFLHPPIDLND